MNFDFLKKRIYSRSTIVEKHIKEDSYKDSFNIDAGLLFNTIDKITEKILLQTKIDGISIKDARDILDSIDINYSNEIRQIMYNDINNSFVEKINEILILQKDKFYEKLLNIALSTEFSNRVNNIFSDDSGNILFEINDDISKIKIDDSQVIAVDNILNIKNESLYIDNPFIIDEYYIGRLNYFIDEILYSHTHHLLRKFSETNKLTLSQSLLHEQKLQSVYANLGSICHGEIIRKNDKMTYKFKNSDRELDFKSLSAGLKTFVIIQQLLLNGSLERNGVLILDEPEIHLHPEWQLVFAELMVLLQKHFHLHILLTTHSPYFLRAIQVYAAKHEINDVCKYYMSRLDEQNGRDAYIDDMTGNTRPIFASLARPFQTLEDEKWDL